jgi:SAM-dependent methyltransferase
MSLGFGGDVAEYYAKFRRGYRAEVFEVLQETFALTAADTAVDLGCGTGQLAVPLAARVGHVIGVDPEADMLRLARETAARHGVNNAVWVLGADTDVPALAALLAGRRPAVAVIGQALHWMRYEDLFAELRSLLRPGGGVAVVANGAPAWQQDSEWSRALRGCLEEHFATRLKDSCGTAQRDRERYARALEAAGFADVSHTEVSYTEEITFEELIGGVYSAVPEDQLPAPADRPAFAERIRRALPPGETFTEDVCVSILTARVPTGP